jgi:membrane peptidoglycan carboxypeptidase
MTHHQFVSLDELAPEAITEVRRPASNALTAALAILAICSVIGAIIAGSVIPVVSSAAGATRDLSATWDGFPSELPLAAALPQHTVLLDKAGVEFARFYTENRVDVSFEQISPNFSNALVATEDQRFYEHSGVDPLGIVRAAVKNYLNDNQSEGGSTITQQLVQNILVSNATNDVERAVAEGDTYEAKAREAKYAVALEKTMTKQEILAAYSNAVFLGQKAYGVQAAARVYFSTDAASLTVPQAAMLVALLKSPVLFDPFVYPEDALDRRNLVIDRMATEGYITAAERDAAIATPIELLRSDAPTGCATSAYPHYCELVRQELVDNPAFGETPELRQEAFRRGGVTLTTALDRRVADASNAAANAALGPDNQFGSGSATVVPGTGHIAAVAQNHSWARTQLVFATRAFQPGSVMKPLTLVTGLEQGMTLSTSYTASGPYIPRGMDYPQGGFTNFGKQNFGSIDARTAIKQSVNIYFVKMIEKVGVLNVIDMSKRLGITTIRETGDNAIGARSASFSLGVSEVTPLQMANVYATFASGGVKCNTVAIIGAVRTTTGEPLPVPATDCHQELSPEVAAQMDVALRGTFQGGTLSGVGAVAGHETGGKTGTTDESSANWTVGMTTQYATAVWVGHPEAPVQFPLKRVQAYGRTFFNTTGSAIAGRIWKSIMADIHVGVPAVPFPRP